jgi:hypothetical protein
MTKSQESGEEEEQMNWFAAHIILVVKFKDHSQTRFPVWENIVLIRADSEEEAIAKAEARGRDDEGDDDGTFRWGGKPAVWVFVGVRKVTLCEDAGKRPGDGTELSYLEFEAPSMAAVEKLIDGTPVRLTLKEKFPTIREA